MNFTYFNLCVGPLHDPVTWYKITYTGEQVAQWDFKNNAPAFVLEVPLCNLLTSICNFVPCDRVVQSCLFYLRSHLHQMQGDHVPGRCRPATGTCEALQGKNSVSYPVSDKATQLTPNKTIRSTAYT